MPNDANVSSINSHQTYIDALALYDALIAAHSAGVTREVLHEHWEKLFSFILENFENPDITLELVNHWRAQFSIGREYNPMAERIRILPPVFIETIWPLAAFKALLSEHKIPISVRSETMPASDKFITVYKNLLIA